MMMMMMMTHTIWSLCVVINWLWSALPAGEVDLILWACPNMGYGNQLNHDHSALETNNPSNMQSAVDKSWHKNRKQMSLLCAECLAGYQSPAKHQKYCPAKSGSRFTLTFASRSTCTARSKKPTCCVVGCWRFQTASCCSPSSFFDLHVSSGRIPLPMPVYWLADFDSQCMIIIPISLGETDRHALTADLVGDCLSQFRECSVENIPQRWTTRHLKHDMTFVTFGKGRFDLLSIARIPLAW